MANLIAVTAGKCLRALRMLGLTNSQPRACQHYFYKCERDENNAYLGAGRCPDWSSGQGVQRQEALFSSVPFGLWPKMPCALLPNLAGGGCPGCIGRLAQGIFVAQRTLVKVVLTGPSTNKASHPSVGAATALTCCARPRANAETKLPAQHLQAMAQATTQAPHGARPLRVVQVSESQPGRSPSQRSSKLLISGRMADVCAELDRLVALENTPRSASAHAAAALPSR